MTKYLLLLVYVFTLNIGFAQEWEEKIDEVVFDHLASFDEVDVIVHLRANADLRSVYNVNEKNAKGIAVFDKLTSFAQTSQKKLTALLDAKKIIYNPYWIVNAVWAKVNIENLSDIASLAEVKLITFDPWIKMDEPIIHSDQMSMRNQIEWGIYKIGADQVWEMGYTGQGIVIGGQDTGYDWSHPALSNKYKGWDGYNVDHNYNWHDAIHEINPMHGDSIILPTNNPCGLDATIPCDDHGHGTHTMGTMLGDDGNGNQIGVAPGAKWIGCRNMERGYGKPSTYLECFEWFLAPTDLNGENPDPLQAPHVINNSWSCPVQEGCNPSNFDLLEMAINNLRAAGVVVVVSAGNDGYQGCSSVANPSAIFEGSFTIGATNFVDTLAGFSSKGPVEIDSTGRLKPDISAPGVWVRSSIRDSSYTRMSGTSMAGPHVAGSVALLLSSKPELAGEVAEIEEILNMNAVPAYPDTSTINNHPCGDFTTFPNSFVGYGRIDVLEAVRSLIQTKTNNIENELGIEVTPNPFYNELIVQSTIYISQGIFELFNIHGTRIELFDLYPGFNWQIPLSHMESAPYFYRISDQGFTQTGILIKIN